MNRMPASGYPEALQLRALSLEKIYQDQPLGSQKEMLGLRLHLLQVCYEIPHFNTILGD